MNNNFSKTFRKSVTAIAVSAVIGFSASVYANTGGQRSSSTPIGSSATTSPAGKVSYGEKKNKKSETVKNLLRIFHFV